MRRVFWLLVWLITCWSSNKRPVRSTMGRGAKPGCVRSLDGHYIFQDSHTLEYLEIFTKQLEDLRAKKVVRNATINIAIDTIRSSTHALCKVGRQHRKKRQLALAAGLVGVIGGLGLPSILRSLFYPSQSTAEMREFMKRTRGLAALNSKRIDHLQKQLEKLQQHDDAEELIADIFELLHQESKKFNLILNPRTRFSPFLEDLLKIPIEHFKLQLGPAWKRNLKPGQIPIPEKAYYVDLATETAEDCSDARVNLTVYSPLPTGECEEILQAGPDYILTETSGGRCRALPPLYTLIELPDSSFFSPFNNFVIDDCKSLTYLNNFTFHFDSASNAFYAAPTGKGELRTTCGNNITNKFHRRGELEPGVFVQPLPQCHSWLNSGDSPFIFHQGHRFITSQGERIAGPLAKSGPFMFLKDFTNELSTPTSEPTTANWLDALERLEALDTSNNTAEESPMDRDKVIAIICSSALALIGLSVAVWKGGRKLGMWERCSRAQSTPPPTTRRYSIGDIEVLPRRNSTTWKWAVLNKELDGLALPRAAGDRKRDLLPMDPLDEAADVHTFTSFVENPTIMTTP